MALSGTVEPLGGVAGGAASGAIPSVSRPTAVVGATPSCLPAVMD